jgi:hypothetical protein
MKKQWIWPGSLIFVILASLAGCSPGAPRSAENSGKPLSGLAPTSGPSMPAGLPETPAGMSASDAENNEMHGTQMMPAFGDAISENVKLAKQDLAKKLGIAVDGITVSAVIGQEFSEDAFECRTTKERIGKEDPPALISGFSILLSTSGQRYEYHASGQSVIFCRVLF